MIVYKDSLHCSLEVFVSIVSSFAYTKRVTMKANGPVGKW